ncbi:MAG: exodeoxyribonuclease III [Proteobacteria bacterium]|nr:exodeoxyribonuclease III [Burkholderiales bacterium]
MKLATWNVNSLKVRLPHVLDWIERHRPDALCLQETKIEDANFPVSAFTDAGYHAVFTGQKTYNGVAIIARTPPQAVVIGIPDFDDPQKRVISASIEGMRLVCAYVPNGETVESAKYVYKLDWLARFRHWLEREAQSHPALAVLGDYNIAPEDRDVYDPVAWAGKVLCSEPERSAFRGLVALGLDDAFRRFDQPPRSWSWWDYRMNMFRRKLGLRIDHILLSAPLAERCGACTIDASARAAERPSDHAPVCCELDWPTATAAAATVSPVASEES